MDNKQNTPSVIGKLMGFDELPPQQPNYRHLRVLSEDYLRKSAAIDLQLKRPFYEDRLSKKKVQKQQEFNYGNKSEENCKRLEKKTARGNVLRSLQKLDGDSTITGKDYMNKLLKSPLQLKDEIYHSPTRIFVFRQSLGKTKIGARSSFSPSSRLCFSLSYRNQGIHRANKEIIRQTKQTLYSKSKEISRPEARVGDTYCENLCVGKNKDKRESEQWKITENSQEPEVDSKEFTPYQKSRAGNMMNYTIDEHPQNVGEDPKSRLRKEPFYNGNFSMLEKVVTGRKQENMKKERLKLRDSRFHCGKSLSSSYVHFVNNNNNSQSVEKTPLNHEEKTPVNNNHEELAKKLLDLSEKISVVSKWEDLDYNYSLQGIEDEPETEDVQFRNAGHSYSEICGSSTRQMQKSSVNSLEDGLNFSSCTKIDSEFSVSSGETYQPSPNSVLETPFTEDILSASKCFENVNADLYGVLMQLHHLKSEKDDTNTEEPFMLVSSDDDSMNESVDYSQENYRFTEKFRPEESRNFSYLSDVLDEADFFGRNLESSFGRFYSPEMPLDPSMFNVLEKKYGNQTWWKKSERKLLFDRINLGLMEILRPYRTDSNTRSKPLKNRVSDTLTRNVIEEDLWVLLISQENEVNNDLSGKAVGKDIMWLDLGDDIDSIARDIEIFLIDELVAELV